MPTKFKKDLTGETHNELTVMGWDKETSLVSPHNYWFCKCSCGREELITVDYSNLIKGHTKSCGCARHNSGKLNFKQGRL